MRWETVLNGERIIGLRALFSKREFALEPMDLNEATREVLALSSGDLQRNRVTSDTMGASGQKRMTDLVPRSRFPSRAIQRASRRATRQLPCDGDEVLDPQRLVEQICFELVQIVLDGPRNPVVCRDYRYRYVTCADASAYSSNEPDTICQRQLQVNQHKVWPMYFDRVQPGFCVMCSDHIEAVETQRTLVRFSGDVVILHDEHL